MKTFIQVSAILMVTTFVLVNTCSAQLINWNRRSKAGHTNEGGGASNAQQAVSRSGYNQSSSAITETVSSVTGSKIRVSNRIEEMYDLNKDGNLQTTEVNSFLKDVVSAVQRKGTFSASSSILKQYDKNNDGLINAAESKAIQQSLR